LRVGEEPRRPVKPARPEPAEHRGARVVDGLADRAYAPLVAQPPDLALRRPDLCLDPTPAAEIARPRKGGLS
jgi:hypothetical protein